jgi:AraC family transcriptional regulator, regulatory protein of adaptative response / methylated-DNA-[protein]-cysteine methyltransferase
MDDEKKYLRPFPDPDSCWKAIMERDTRCDGTFFYGVISTGVYCKPSCASRLPGRDKVKFFRTGEEAEKSGFRPCKRCRPQDQLHSNVTLIISAFQLIVNSESLLSLNDISLRLNISPSHFHRIFRKVTGVTPRQFQASQMLQRFKRYVRGGKDVGEALYEAGYGSNSRLYEIASRDLGMTPRAYRLGGCGMNIHYAMTSCDLGRLLVAATELGICSVCFGDDDNLLAANLRQEYPQAVLTQDNGFLEKWITPLIKHLEGTQPDLDLPLDIKATSFQLKVWAVLRNIPYGQTRTYSEVAKEIGQPAAVRAVARACATNPVALVNPCHRVVRNDGSLAGYRWGIERKKALINREKESRNP